MKTGGNDIDIGAVEDHGGILTIRGGGARRDWNGIHYKQGISGKNVGTTSLSANIATIPPGGVAYAHIHDFVDTNGGDRRLRSNVFRLLPFPSCTPL